MYYDYGQPKRNYEELKAFIIEKVKPFKLIAPARYENYRYQPRQAEGLDPSEIDTLVGEIETNSTLSISQKIKLEEMISERVNKERNYPSYGAVNRGLYNVLLMVRNNATGMRKGYRLTSTEGLKKHALVFTTYRKVKRTYIVEGLEDVVGSKGRVEEKEVQIYVLGLTEFGKQELSNLNYKGQRVVNKEKMRLHKLGEI